MAEGGAPSDPTERRQARRLQGEQHLTQANTLSLVIGV
ncbi:hypothetical protein DB31_2216 [Hyalangium minutum]|uniref:Uncharacterized protein n=1 Tax=Hyalangium minutum TaxID=394096 RepID=A0A085W9Q9_9BACT|nr:hypothetical protein DB31_2216 [Hyalangium minutum]